MSDFKSNYGFTDEASKHSEDGQDAAKKAVPSEAADGAASDAQAQEALACETRADATLLDAQAAGDGASEQGAVAGEAPMPDESRGECACACKGECAPDVDPDSQVPVDEYNVDDEIPDDPRLVPKAEIIGKPAEECKGQDVFPTDSGHNRDLGMRGERAAAAFLQRRGMEIVERNWTCVAGEADIIGYEDGTLHFIEVKTRNGIDKGFPAEAVTQKKRRRYEKIAACFLAQSEYANINVSFDIISIVVTGPNRAFLRYHRNAFSHWE